MEVSGSRNHLNVPRDKVPVIIYAVVVCLVVAALCGLGGTYLMRRPAPASQDDAAQDVDVETLERQEWLENRFDGALPEGSRVVIDRATGVRYVVGDDFMCPVIDSDVHGY
jgi:hypothetical protein